MKSSPSFTLIELVIVIGILAVLAAVVVIVINPAEYMKSSRDSQRVSELQTITKAIGLYLGDGKSNIGSTNIVYVSIPDASSTCANLGLPTLPGGWTYQCSTSANYRKTDGTGWLPINFSSISFGNTMETLPIDPVNATSTGNYYTYITGGSFELTAAMESSKYKLGGANDKASKDGGTYPELYETGSNLTLLPVNYGDTSLVGYWKFDEGSGTTAYDASGHGNNGTLTFGPAYITGKVGSYALSFDGVNDYVEVLHNSIFNFGTGGFTVAGWVYIKGEPSTYGAALIDKGSGDFTNTPLNQIGFWLTPARNSNLVRDMTWAVGNGLGDNYTTYSIGNASLQGVWHHVVGVADSQSASSPKLKLYVDGVLANSANRVYTGSIDAVASNLCIGKSCAINRFLNANIDDVRVYNEALTAAEVSALYTATNR